MDEMKKDNNIMNGKGDGGHWITMPNGAKVFVPDGMSKEEAVETQFEKTNEFRRQNKKIDKFEHPIHLYAKNDKFAKGHSLTTTIKEKGITADAKEMRINPNPQDKRKSYFIPTSKTVPLSELSTKQLKGWKLNKSDDKVIKPFRDPPFNE